VLKLCVVIVGVTFGVALHFLENNQHSLRFLDVDFSDEGLL